MAIANHEYSANGGTILTIILLIVIDCWVFMICNCHWLISIKQKRYSRLRISWEKCLDCLVLGSAAASI